VIFNESDSVDKQPDIDTQPCNIIEKISVLVACIRLALAVDAIIISQVQHMLAMQGARVADKHSCSLGEVSLGSV